jgi:predicted  nucleic acid-binding Zn-ribbon protein
LRNDIAAGNPDLKAQVEKMKNEIEEAGQRDQDYIMEIESVYQTNSEMEEKLKPLMDADHAAQYNKAIMDSMLAKTHAEEARK